ncbi:hypothetical protein ACFE04_013786 [Oxalis oulophora]
MPAVWTAEVIGGLLWTTVSGDGFPWLSVTDCDGRRVCWETFFFFLVKYCLCVAMWSCGRDGCWGELMASGVFGDDDDGGREKDGRRVVLVGCGERKEGGDGVAVATVLCI